MSEDVKMTEIPEEVVAVIKRENLTDDSGVQLIKSFAPYHQEITHALDMSKGITDGELAAHQKMARTCRLELRRIRCDIERTRKDAKADALRYGKAVDGMANVLKFLCEPEEKRLEDIEKHAERMEEKRIAELVATRTEKLIEVELDPAAYNIAAMDEDTFRATVDLAIKAKQERIEAERKAEEERIAKEKADAEERERMRLENAKLKAEAEAKEKALAKERAEREKAEAERKRKEEHDALKAKQEAEAQANKEKDKAHRKSIMNAAYKSLVENGIDKNQAESVVVLIADNKILNIRIEW